MRPTRIIIALVAALCCGTAAQAASLSVAPILIDLSAPVAASSVRIRNDAQKPVNVQVRLFRWSQANGEDVFTAASDVVASPPITTLKPGGENMVRIVRTAKTPIRGEESYRLIVDELPDPSRRTTGTIVLVVRQSIPVFFSQPDAPAASAVWSVQAKAGGWQVSVANGGGKRLKISNLVVTSGKTVLAKRDGLVGYALGQSTARWFIAATSAARPAGRTATIGADSDAGRIDATASVNGG